MNKLNSLNWLTIVSLTAKVDSLLLRRKKKLKVDIRELEDETEALSDFLRSKLRIDITASGNELSIDSENLSPKELKRFVNKFIYHRSIMNKYWVALTDNVVKVKKFKHSEKHEKRKERELLLQRLSTVGKSMLSRLKSKIIQPFWQLYEL